MIENTRILLLGVCLTLFIMSSVYQLILGRSKEGMVFTCVAWVVFIVEVILKQFQ